MQDLSDRVSSFLHQYCVSYMGRPVGAKYVVMTFSGAVLLGIAPAPAAELPRVCSQNCVTSGGGLVVFQGRVAQTVLPASHLQLPVLTRCSSCCCRLLCLLG